MGLTLTADSRCRVCPRKNAGFHAKSSFTLLPHTPVIIGSLSRSWISRALTLLLLSKIHQFHAHELEPCFNMLRRAYAFHKPFGAMSPCTFVLILPPIKTLTLGARWLHASAQEFVFWRSISHQCFGLPIALLYLYRVLTLMASNSAWLITPASSSCLGFRTSPK